MNAEFRMLNAEGGELGRGDARCVGSSERSGRVVEKRIHPKRIVTVVALDKALNKRE